MKFKIKPLVLGIACAGLLTLHGCGGGGGTAVQTTVSGIAATGAAFEGATVEVTDITGNTVGTSTVIGQDGVYTITLAAGATAPFVLTATRPSADGASESLVSVIASVTGTTATANITPITHLIAARLSTSSGDPSKLGAELKGDPTLLTASKVNAKVAEVQKILEPILTATSTETTDPLTGSFTVDGTGYDRLLDSIKISVIPDDKNASNIEISIKQQQADDAQPDSIQFSSADQATDVPVLPSIDKNKLVVAGTADRITSFLAQLTSCYALPLATRVDSTISNDLATGTAANVVAEACKNAFWNKEPSNFKHNGNVVGRDDKDNGPFKNLFKEGATNLVFSQGSYEFTSPKGDIVAGYKSKDSAGNETYDTFVLRLDPNDKKLKLIGNQYAYGGGVSAYQQIRTFVKDDASTYYSTGYALKVPLIDGVAYVKITTPKDKTLTLIRGSDGMDFPKLNASRQAEQSDRSTTSDPSAMVPSGTSFVRIRSEYADKNSKATHPAERDTGLFFTPTDELDENISEYRNQSLWVFKYYDSSKNELATQSYKTRARANTIAEMRTRAWAGLDKTSLDNLKSDFEANKVVNSTINGYTKLPTSGLLTPTWEVPSGARPPTEVRLYGKASPNADGSGIKVPFNDGQLVGSTKRTVPISCKNGSGEKHCVTNESGTGTGYTTNAFMTGLHLWARDTSGREYVNFYATYKLN